MLNNKRILFISPRFFDYHQQISEKLKNLGAEVTYFDERPQNNTLTKLIIRLAPNILEKEISKYYRGILEQIKNQKFDYFFLVKGETIPLFFLEEMSISFPNTTKVFMMWDSVANYTRVLDKVKFFDKTCSFDKNDCQKYGFDFRPLFYNEKYLSLHNSKTSVDLSFLGTIHSDRLNILESIKAKYNNKTYDYFMYLQSPLVFWVKKLTDKAFMQKSKSDFDFTSLSGEQVMKKIANAKIIIDIEHPGQTGLTMRTIEMLGANKKLVTTNDTVKDYDFYNPKNICVINRNNIEISEEFFEEEFQPLSAEIMHKYSLTGFVEEIFTI